jgi:hypothetical protein
MFAPTLARRGSRSKDPPTSGASRLAADLTGSDYALGGTLARRQMRCDKPNCCCKAEPPVLLGPHLHWTRTVVGKTVTCTSTPEQAQRYQPWFDNARRLRNRRGVTQRMCGTSD